MAGVAPCVIPYELWLETTAQCIQRGMATLQVYNMKQAQADIESVYSMGLFDDVNILPSPAEDATSDAPKASLLCCGCAAMCL
jgi:outer membrane protein assembly factor BamA